MLNFIFKYDPRDNSSIVKSYSAHILDFLDILYSEFSY